MKKSSFRAQKVKSTFYKVVSKSSLSHLFPKSSSTHVVRVVLLQDPAPAFVDLLVALAGTAHAQRGVHVHVVAGKIQTDQALEDDGPARESGGQEDQQAGRCAPIRHHVQHGTKLCRLVELARGHTIQSIEEAGNAVEQRACAWV